MLVRKLITAPALGPVSLEEAKAHLRITENTEQDGVLIPQLIDVARTHLETICNRVFITQTWEVYYEQFPAEDCISLPLGQLQSVTEFEWTDSAAQVHAWTVSGLNLMEGAIVRAHVNKVEEPGEIELAYDQTWPTDTLKTANPIRIKFTCGYGDDSSAVPAPIKQAMLLQIGHLYEHTSEVSMGQSAVIDSKMTARGVDALIENYRLRY